MVLLLGSEAYSPFRLDAIKEAVAKIDPSLGPLNIDAKWVYALELADEAFDVTELERAASLLNADGTPAVTTRLSRDRQGNLLDLAINRRNAEAVRYMLKRGLIAADALADYLEKSAERNRVEITALMLEYGHKTDNTRDLFDEDPFR